MIKVKLITLILASSFCLLAVAEDQVLKTIKKECPVIYKKYPYFFNDSINNINRKQTEIDVEATINDVVSTVTLLCKCRKRHILVVPTCEEQSGKTI